MLARLTMTRLTMTSLLVLTKADSRDCKQEMAANIQFALRAQAIRSNDMYGLNANLQCLLQIKVTRCLAQIHALSHLK